MLYQTHRPKTLEEVVGNSATVEALRQVLSRPANKRPRAFLFEGPSGCGKTTLARIVASTLGVGDFDFQEMNTADFRGIDMVRELIQRMNRKALGESGLRCWLLDECHSLTKDAQNALLKVLEDTPEHAILILATTDPEKLLPTIRNRCTRFSVEPLNEKDMFKLVRVVAKKEGKNISTEVLHKIADTSLGSPRAALTALDKVLDLPADQQEKAIEDWQKKETQVIELCRALIGKQSWKQVAAILSELRNSADPEEIRRAVLGYCTSILLKESNAKAYAAMSCFRPTTYDTGFPGIVLAAFEAVHMSD